MAVRFARSRTGLCRSSLSDPAQKVEVKAKWKTVIQTMATPRRASMVSQVGQDFPNLRQRESQRLRTAHKAHALSIACFVGAVSVVLALRRVQQALLFVVPQGVDGHAGGLGQFADFHKRAF
jgi:hypothetical protein